MLVVDISVMHVVDVYSHTSSGVSDSDVDDSSKLQQTSNNK